MMLAALPTSIVPAFLFFTSLASLSVGQFDWYAQPFNFLFCFFFFCILMYGHRHRHLQFLLCEYVPFMSNKNHLKEFLILFGECKQPATVAVTVGNQPYSNNRNQDMFLWMANVVKRHMTHLKWILHILHSSFNQKVAAIILSLLCWCWLWFFFFSFYCGEMFFVRIPLFFGSKFSFFFSVATNQLMCM